MNCTQGSVRLNDSATPLFEYKHFLVGWGGSYGSEFRTAVIFFYLSNEGIFILENAVNIGLPIPEKLKNVLEQLKEGNRPQYIVVHNTDNFAAGADAGAHARAQYNGNLSTSVHYYTDEKDTVYQMAVWKGK